MQPRREYNIVVLGAGGVGKSCLTAQFVQNVWIESYDPTIEDSYRKVVDVDGKSTVLEILDTAGTEQFTSMREIYLKSGQGFLLVYSITSLSSFNELAPIRDAILRIKEVDEVPMVICGNKSDLEGDRQVSKNRANHISKKWGNVPLYESSAKKRLHVDDAFMNLTRQMIRMMGATGTQKEGDKKEESHQERSGSQGGDMGKGKGKKRLCTIL
ncbi:ras-related protein RSR1 [Pyronema domesticum]|nr:ras-related protein RSR1 [Pyronema domesticum]